MTEYEVIKRFGYNLRMTLAARDISQSELSRMTDIPRQTINDYSNGKTMPSVKNLYNIAYKLRIDVTDLINPKDLIY